MADEKKGGRPKTGTIVKTRDGRWQALITLADGHRWRVKPPFPKGTSEKYARERAAYWSEDAQKRGITRAAMAVEQPPAVVASKDSCEPWFKLWIADREARGFTATRDNGTHYRMHIAPSIGDKHVRDWTRDDLRKLSRDLDTKVQAGDLSWKTAINVWGTATKMAADAAESKRDDIRCRTDDPSAGVRGPDRGDDKGKQFLYPSEFLQFARCQAVPLRWRRLVAVAVYTYVRDAELRAIDTVDVDLEHGSAHVTKALNRRTGAIKATKGRRRRHVPLEPAILPLLSVMVSAGSGGPLVPDMPSDRDMARGLRRWLKRAGVTRRELHCHSPTTVPITFHDLRATGITWQAVRGDDGLKIMQRAGHRDFETTQRYIRLAEMLRDGFGEVFPRLPPELYESSPTTEDPREFRSQVSIAATQVSEIWRGGRDSNPRPPA